MGNTLKELIFTELQNNWCLVVYLTTRMQSDLILEKFMYQSSSMPTMMFLSLEKNYFLYLT